MEILQIVGLALITVVLYLLLKESNAEFAIVLIIAFSVIVFLFVINKIQAILGVFGDLAIKANVNLFFLNTIFKIIGIAYIAEFGSQICRDAGSSSVAGKIEFAAKIIIISLAIPIIVAILDSVLKLIP